MVYVVNRYCHISANMLNSIPRPLLYMIHYGRYLLLCYDYYTLTSSNRNVFVPPPHSSFSHYTLLKVKYLGGFTFHSVVRLNESIPPDSNKYQYLTVSLHRLQWLPQYNVYC